MMPTTAAANVISAFSGMTVFERSRRMAFNDLICCAVSGQPGAIGMMLLLLVMLPLPLLRVLNQPRTIFGLPVCRLWPRNFDEMACCARWNALWPFDRAWSMDQRQGPLPALVQQQPDSPNEMEYY
jgi:hypothetical protein